MENKTKARCQVGNKAMKMKLTILWEERKERLDMPSYIEVYKEGLYTLKVYCKGERIVGKGN